MLDIRSFRAADCDSDHCLVVAKIRETLAVHKEGVHKFHVELKIIYSNFKKV
jgi:hypothetical protein